MTKQEPREVKWFAHGHTDSVGQNNNCISDCLTPGPGQFVLLFIAASSWCHFGEEASGGLSNVGQQGKGEMQDAQESWTQ